MCMHINILYIIYVLFYTHTHTHTYIHTGTSLVAQSVKNLSAVQETPVQSLGWEDPLEKEITVYFYILAWRISWSEELGRLQSMGCKSGLVTKSLYIHICICIIHICPMRLVGFGCLTRDWTPTLGNESMESLPLDHQGIPKRSLVLII